MSDTQILLKSDGSPIATNDPPLASHVPLCSEQSAISHGRGAIWRIAIAHFEDSRRD